MVCFGTKFHCHYSNAFMVQLMSHNLFCFDFFFKCLFQKLISVQISVQCRCVCEFQWKKVKRIQYQIGVKICIFLFFFLMENCVQKRLEFFTYFSKRKNCIEILTNSSLFSIFVPVNSIFVS